MKNKNTTLNVSMGKALITLPKIGMKPVAKLVKPRPRVNQINAFEELSIFLIS
jgi:hypothetical protein